ncbi:hypothetical protein CYMTET_35991, partial [Cymbomonas tetramitiformis]
MVASACLLLEHAATASRRFEGDWRGFMRLDLDGDGCISFDEYLIANTGDTIDSIQTNGFVTVLRSEPHKPLLPSHVPEIPKREQNDAEAKFRMLTADDGEASSWSPKSTLKWSRSEEPFDLSAASSGSAAVYNETSLNEAIQDAAVETITVQSDIRPSHVLNEISYRSLAIIGECPDALCDITAGHKSKVFILINAVVTLKLLRLTEGNATGGVVTSAESCGGAAWVRQSILQIKNCTFFNNT